MNFNSSSASTLAIPAVGAFGAYALYKAYGVFLRTTPLDDVRGPPGGSWLWGRFRDLLSDHDGELQKTWLAEYGHVLAHKSLFGVRRARCVAPAHIHRTRSKRSSSRPTCAPSSTSSSTRTRSRRACSSGAYSPARSVMACSSQKVASTARSGACSTLRSVRSRCASCRASSWTSRTRYVHCPDPQTVIDRFPSVFLISLAYQLRDLWLSKLSPTTGIARLNAVSGLSAATLDIIGLAGFGYDFDALARPADDPNELGAAFATLIASGNSPLTLALLGVLPGSPSLPTRSDAARRRARAIMDRIGRQLIAERKATAAYVVTSRAGRVRSWVCSASGKADAGGRDLLSLLVRANMSENAAQRLSDDEILARASRIRTCTGSRSHAAEIPTFILAGHETTSTLVTWTLFQLAQRPALQAELRTELRSLPLPSAAKDNAPLDADTLAALDKVPLLDAVVRETLRANAPFQDAGRVATEDTSIPLARPFVGRDGVLRDEVRVRKGDLITIPILSIHRSTELWGPDAREWKCVRNQHTQVISLTTPTRAGPSVGLPAGHLRPHTPSRGYGRTCCRSWAARTRVSAIASRFSSKFPTPTSTLALTARRTKVLLHALLAGLQFELAVPVAEIAKKSGVVTRPVLASARDQGVQLPVVISRAEE
jgi:cytochrome P450